MGTLDLKDAEVEIRHLTPCLKLTFEGMSDGGTIDLGFDLFGYPEVGSKIILSADFNGFDAVGGITTHNKTIYPTMVKRKMYPDTTVWTSPAIDCEASGSDYIVRVVLTDWIYTNCSNLKLTLLSGVYTATEGISKGVYDFTVTNNSNISYPTTKANYAMPLQGFRLGFNAFTLADDTTGFQDIRIVAYNADAVDGNNGIAAVKIVATGQTSAHVETIFCTLSVDDDTYGDYHPIQEYIGLLPYAGFDQSEVVSINAIVYPYIGETAFDFSAQGNTMPTARPCVHTMICDKLHTYGTPVAVVNTTAGASPAVVPLEDFDPLNPPDAYGTAASAAVAIRTYNNANYGHDNCDGGIIYFQEGNHDLVGSAITNVANSVYLILSKFPGTSRDNVNFTARTVKTYLASTYQMFHSVRFNNNGEVITEVDNVLYYNCDLITATFFHTTTPAAACNIIGSRVCNSTQGLASYSTQALGLRVRGTYYTYPNATQRVAYADVLIGNHIENCALTIYLNKPGNAYGQINGMIIANNYWCLNADVQIMTLIVGSTNGPALVNNIMINQLRTDQAASPLMQVMADNSPVDAYNDMIVWHNLFLGERNNWCYNDYQINETGPAPRLLHSFVGNLMCDFDCVSDLDPHGGTPGGLRYGNHAIRAGVWNNGNICRGTSASTCHPEAGAYNVFTEAEDPMIDLKFVNDQSGRIGVAGSGLGDYHLASDSPALTTTWRRMTKYDFDGKVRRSKNGSSGAYECAALTIKAIHRYHNMLRGN